MYNLQRSPSPSKDLPPPPPSIKSVPDKPPAVPYTQVKPNTNVTNGNKLGIQEDHISSEEDEDDDIYDDAISVSLRMKLDVCCLRKEKTLEQVLFAESIIAMMELNSVIRHLFVLFMF